MPDFRGKRIWLVGASTGIGEALAVRLAEAGAQLILGARSAERIADLAIRLPASASGKQHHAVPVDVTSLQSVKAAWDTLAASGESIDMIIYNAGAYDPMSAQQFDLAKAEAMVDVNFSGALRVLSCVLPDFVARNEGPIVLVASVAAYSGLPNAIGYGASKAALLHLAENLRVDLARSRIKVQAVSPGFVKTRLTAKNSFPMPFIITPEAAADHIMRGLAGNSFEIHFPKRFTYILKFLKLLPYSIYFRLIKFI